ncbi:hypothetical protein CDAR_305361 [Caerostris darwini]|uniref:Uncharacterized protein n=1 Tax=Caerostris darwini TaxID=1538125 RepID=A0AAV4MD29_9ARAC|nr:hypothetical protein CDAR_305361 [Caerostris darwini]
MNSNEMKYITHKAVSLYRKFVSWWTVLDATSRVLKSNFQSIVHYLGELCGSWVTFQSFKRGLTTPLHVFLNSAELVKDNLAALTEEVLILIELSSSNNPESEEDFFATYDIILELQEDLRGNFMDCKKHFKDYCLMRQMILDNFEA